MSRAYSTFIVKSADDEQRVMTGIASTPSTDRVGDIVEPLGVVYKLPLPLLWQHDAEQPIGHVTAASPNAKGIPVTVQMVRVTEPGTLRDRLDEAWQSIKHGLVRGLSIGFKPIEYAFLEDTGGVRFTKWNWLELSAVTIPANADASIATIKRYDSTADGGRAQVRGVKPWPFKGLKWDKIRPDQFASMLGLYVLDSVADNVMLPSLKQVMKKLKALEDEMAEKSYFGVWNQGEHYMKHNMVTHQSSLWICLRSTVGKPGDSADWKLAVKKGGA